MCDAQTYIACALAGLGLIQIPAYDVTHHLVSGEPVQVLAGCAQLTVAMHLVHPHRCHLSVQVQAFGNWPAEVLAPRLIAPENAIA